MDIFIVSLPPSPPKIGAGPEHGNLGEISLLEKLWGGEHGEEFGEKTTPGLDKW